jgi:hypothetical protein
MHIVTDDFEALRPKIAKSMRDTLSAEVRTPDGEKVTPCDVYVADQLIEEVDGEADAAYATITYVAYCPNERRHSVRVKFNYTKQGKFKRESMSYV